MLKAEEEIHNEVVRIELQALHENIKLLFAIKEYSLSFDSFLSTRAIVFCFQNHFTTSYQKIEHIMVTMKLYK
jgi:hypothetical protein